MTTPFQPGMYGDNYNIEQEQLRSEQETAVRMEQFQRNYQTKLAEYEAAVRQQNQMKSQKPGGFMGMLASGWNALPDAITSPVEKTLSGLYWTYSRFVSQPVSFIALSAREAIRNEDKRQNFAEVRELWKEAKHMSPGQSLVTIAYSRDELKSRGIDFDNNTFDKSWFKEGSFWEDGWAWQKAISGTADLAVSWYADPLVLLGKGGAAARGKAVVKPVSDMNLRTPEDFKAAMQNDTFQSMIKLVNDYKARYGEESNVRLANDMRTLRESTDGEALANILAQTRNDGEIADILRIAIGDRSRITELVEKNADLAVQMEKLTSTAVVLDANLAGLNPSIQNTIVGRALQNRIKLNEESMAAVQHQLDSPLLRVDDLTRFEDTLANLYFNRFITPVTTRARTGVRTANKDYRVVGGFTGNRFVDNLITKPIASTVYNGLYVTPLKAYRYVTDIKPPLFIEYADNQSWRSIDAALASITTREGRASDDAFRAEWTSRYQAATVPERMSLVREMEQEAVERIARSFGTEGEAAGLRALYSAYAGLRNRAIGVRARNTYTSVTDDANSNIASIGQDGANEIVAPILRTQLEGNHILTDFAELSKVAKRNGGAIGRMMNGVHPAVNAGVEFADWTNRVWKFSKLLSFAYGIRTVSDDFLSMISRFNASMIVRGHSNLSEQYFRGRWLDDTDEADLLALGINKLDIQDAVRDVNFWKKRRAQFPDRADLANRNIDELETYIKSIEEDQLRLADALRGREEARKITVGGLKFRTETADPLFRAQISSARSNERLMSGPQGRELRKMRGSSTSEMGSGVWRPLKVGEDGYAEAWHRVLTRQYANDQLAMTYIRTGSIEEMAKFLRSPAGKEYRAGMPKREIDEHIDIVRSDIDDMIPPMAPYADAIREGLIKGELDIKILDEIRNSHRPPEIREELSRFNLGTAGDHPAGQVLHTIDNAIDGWYKLVNSMPTDRLIRNPMANSLYRGHLKDLVKAKGEQNITKLGNDELLRLEDVARRRTVQDIKKFSFSLDHMSRAAWGMRFVSPFFGAKIESFQRWGRVIADRPQTIGHAGTLFNTPMKMGAAYDRDGNKIAGDGTITDPLTGEKKMVPKGDRMWRVQLPSWAADGIEKATGTRPEFTDISIDSLNLTLQDDPVWSPGYGPFVQIPAEKWGQIWGSPEDMQAMRTLGILPMGSTTDASLTSGPTWAGATIKAVKRYFDSDARNTDATAVMRQMDIEYRMGLRSKPPTFKEARDKANNFSLFKALSRIVVPFSQTYQEALEIDQDARGVSEELKGKLLPIQFFLDEYNKMQNAGIPDADQAFLDKYGESFFAFTVAMSRNNTGVSPTLAGVASTVKYKKLLDKIDPDLHALVVGPEGIGPFSQEAYYYQLNTETQDGSGKTQRERMSPREYQVELERRSGWRLFSSMMNKIQANMLEAGYASFDERGAEEFAAQKRGLVALLTQNHVTAEQAVALGIENPRGKEFVENPYYNRDWEEDWNTQDRGFYERRILDLTAVANEPDLDPRINPMRADIRGLREYLSVREAVTIELSKRKSDDLNAKGNADLKGLFRQFVFDISERNIAFAELHNRYLSRDLGVDMPWE